jgi:hypothetical protein
MHFAPDVRVACSPKHWTDRKRPKAAFHAGGGVPGETSMKSIRVEQRPQLGWGATFALEPRFAPIVEKLERQATNDPRGPVPAFGEGLRRFRLDDPPG